MSSNARSTRRKFFDNTQPYRAWHWCLALLLAAGAGHAGETRSDPRPAADLLGPNVHIVTRDMPLAAIQQLVDAVTARQIDNHFGTDRDAILFEPGTYGSASNPLTIKLGYYTAVAGLGANPADVVINGRILVRNRCMQGGCLALDNFWRSLENLTLHVITANGSCDAAQIWAVSQAAPVRRLHVTGGDFRLADFCTQPSWSSGGFIADSVFDGLVENGSQQQFLVRNSRLQRWVGGNWNQVFAGVEGGLPPCTSDLAACPFATLARTPVVREAPYLYLDKARHWQVFHPAIRRDTAGPSWVHGPEPGESIPLERFFIASPQSGTAAINRALREGKHLLLTPGLYRLEEPLEVAREGTVVLGLGFPTLVPQRGTPALRVRASRGVAVAGLLFEAGPVNSPVLMQLGEDTRGDAANPSSAHDVFFRIGGAGAGSAQVSLRVSSSEAILDHVWAWRADHGEGVGWTSNLADTGLVVDGANVTAYGLFVEHYQKHEVLWNGEGGRVVFFQNEMPYDPPSQPAWRSARDVDGYAALKVAPGVARFQALGMGSYSYFNQGVPIFAERAFEVPTTLAAGSLQDVFTIFLNVKAAGGIRHVVNDAGGASTVANPDVAVRVLRYP